MFFVIKIESNKNLKPNNEDFKIKILQFICLVNREIISEENMTLKFIFSDKLFIDIINFCSELNYLNNKNKFLIFDELLEKSCVIKNKCKNEFNNDTINYIKYYSKFQKQILKTKVGSIDLFLGPMYAGKSLKIYHICKNLNLTCIKPSNLESLNDNEITHNGDKLKSIKFFSDINQIADDYDLLYEISIKKIICVDEGQFFPDLLNIISKLFFSGIKCNIGGLTGTFDLKSWKSITDLIGIATTITHVKSICYYCNNEASYSQRITSETNLEVIDTNKYIPVCGKCFRNKKN